MPAIRHERIYSRCEVPPGSELGNRIKIFDEDHLVTLLVVNQIIYEFFCQQHAKAPWPQPLFFTNRHVTEQILGRVADGCVAELFERKPLARILDAAGYCTTRTDEGDFHVLAGIEICAMLHGVD